MDGGLRGGGYGPTFIFCTSPPMNSRAAAVAAASTASATTSLVGAALANAAAADASATSDTTRSALRALVRFASATEHDLQFTVCAKYRSSSSSFVGARGAFDPERYGLIKEGSFAWWCPLAYLSVRASIWLGNHSATSWLGETTATPLPKRNGALERCLERSFEPFGGCAAAPPRRR